MIRHPGQSLECRSCTVMQARVHGPNANIQACSPTRTVLLLRAREMLVAQLGSVDGGSTTTAAVMPSTECQPRLEMALHVALGYALVGTHT